LSDFPAYCHFHLLLEEGEVEANGISIAIAALTIQQVLAFSTVAGEMN